LDLNRNEVELTTNKKSSRNLPEGLGCCMAVLIFNDFNLRFRLKTIEVIENDLIK